MITKAELDKLGICNSGYGYFIQHYESIKLEDLIKDLLKHDQEIQMEYNTEASIWCFYLLTRVLSPIENIRVALYAGESTLAYAKEEDKQHLQSALDLIHNWLENPSQTTLEKLRLIDIPINKINRSIGYALRTVLDNNKSWTVKYCSYWGILCAKVCHNKYREILDYAVSLSHESDKGERNVYEL